MSAAHSGKSPSRNAIIISSSFAHKLLHRVYIVYINDTFIQFISFFHIQAARYEHMLNDVISNSTTAAFFWLKPSWCKWYNTRQLLKRTRFCGHNSHSLLSSADLTETCLDRSIRLTILLVRKDMSIQCTFSNTVLVHLDLLGTFPLTTYLEKSELNLWHT